MPSPTTDLFKNIFITMSTVESAGLFVCLFVWHLYYKTSTTLLLYLFQFLQLRTLTRTLKLTKSPSWNTPDANCFQYFLYAITLKDIFNLSLLFFFPHISHLFMEIYFYSWKVLVNFMNARSALVKNRCQSF